MRTKLTLRIDEDLIRRAKTYSRQSGKSVSQLVADYLAILPEHAEQRTFPALTPIVKSLLGALEGAPADELDYRLHLEEKYL
ncbi:MAG: DUF6364 family protein [Acidobacteriota bacterium]|nr:DUF6364 family protein [Acidobacteriota bacterium]